MDTYSKLRFDQALELAETFDRGFSPAMFIEPVEQRLFCTYCQHVVRNPIQRMCGHNWCSSCHDKAKRNLHDSQQQSCPKCEAEGDNSGVGRLIATEESYHDFGAQRQLNALRVKCTYCDDYAPTTLAEYIRSEHETNCAALAVPCPNKCSATRVSAAHLRDHLARTCERRVVECVHCRQGTVWSDLAVHATRCELAPVECTLCHTRLSARRDLPMHAQRDCVYVECNMGCTKPIRRADEANHYTSPQAHAHHADHARRTMAHVTVFLRESGTDTAGALRNDVNAVSAVMEALHEQAKRNSDLIFSLTARVDTQTRTNAGLVDRVMRLEAAQHRLTASVVDTNYRLHLEENKKQRGVLLWRIDGVARLWNECELKTGEEASILSEPFYTSDCGYKMCARFYINGDGIGKVSDTRKRDGYLSVFFALMRGKHDGLLQFPFRQKVTMMLLDYTNDKHHVDAFRPVLDSSSFYKPTSDMNVATGCPLFMRHVDFTAQYANYVRDDTMWIKMIVDCSDIPY